MAEEGKPEIESFWSFIINDVSFTKARYTIHGHFIYLVLTADKDGKHLDFRYLTPPDRPFEMELPVWMFPDKRFDKVAPIDVVDRFVEIFSETPCAVIPEAPTAISLENLPPRKRKAAKMAAAKQREGRLMPWLPLK